jgi:hypothetical protein
LDALIRTPKTAASLFRPESSTITITSTSTSTSSAIMSMRFKESNFGLLFPHRVFPHSTTRVLKPESSDGRRCWPSGSGWW